MARLSSAPGARRWPCRPRGQPPPFAPLPQLHQGELEQRQGPRLARDVPEQHLDQPRLELVAGQQGGPLDGAAEFILGHRTDQELVVRHRRGQRGVRSALAVEIGPHRQQDDRLPAGDGGGIKQVGEQGLAGLLVLAEREDLLELVHQQDQPARRRGVAEREAGGQVQRVLGGLQSAHQSLHRDGGGPGGAVEARQRDGQALDRVAAGLEDDDGPFGAADEFAPLDGGDQPRPGQRRLAAARGAEDRQEAVLLARGRGPQLDDQPLGQRLAAEEERGVLDVEDLQPAVGTRALEGRAAEAGAGLDAPNAADQSVEGVLIVE